MFDQLQSRLDKVLTAIRGEGKITESNIDSALRDVRRALLEADVNYKVVKSFIIRVKEKSYGQIGIVCTVNHSHPHRGIAHERFLAGGPFAILPMQKENSKFLHCSWKNLS